MTAAHLAFRPRAFSTLLTNNVIGAGGFLTNGDIANDGTVIAGSDVGSPVFLAPGAAEWTPFLRPGINMDGTLLDSMYDVGTYATAICATNALVAYCVVMGRVWKTTDGVVTVTRTALAKKANCISNESARTTGKPLAVDPANSNVVFFGAPDGLHYSVDGGANWTDVSTGTIPAPTAGRRMCIAFDRSSAVTGGKTQGIYVLVNGSGLYHTANGGSTWAAVSGAPTAANRMVVGETDGYVHLIGDGAGNDGQYRRWDKASWIAPTSIIGHSVVLSTLDAGRMWLTFNGGILIASADNGVSWPDYGDYDTGRVATDITWHAWTDETWMADGELLFDRANNRLWALEGIGAWTKDSPAGIINAPTTWTERSKGIENMVTTLVDVGPDGKVLYACHDRTAFVIPRASAGAAFPSTHAAFAGDSIVHGTNVDYALDDPSFLVAGSFNEGNPPLETQDGKYSADGGTTWDNMPGSISTASGNYGGGNIIALSKTVFIQVETNNGFLMRTTDAGATWTRCSIGNNNDTHGHAAYWLNRRVLVKDQYVPGQAYYYHVGDQSGSADNLNCLGIWKTTDYGETWTRVLNRHIITADVDKWNGKLRQYGANDWLWCGGDGAMGLWRSVDGMEEWAEVIGTDDVTAATKFGEVLGVAVGMGLSEDAPKAVVVMGHRQVTPAHATDYSGFGLWESIDGMQTWKRLAQFPNGRFGLAADIAADPGQSGRYYIGWTGEGLTQVDRVAA